MVHQGGVESEDNFLLCGYFIFFDGHTMHCGHVYIHTQVLMSMEQRNAALRLVVTVQLTVTVADISLNAHKVTNQHCIDLLAIW